jgi:Peptidase family M41/ATPase family associated with various cellular activities (AAA)
MAQRIDLDRDEIRRRSELLTSARDELREHFIGIHEMIDELIDTLRVWYLMPEVLTRPVIVNLWGMTGVGKTDLVRRLVKILNMQDRFAEVELSNGDTTQWHSSVGSVLERNGLQDSKPKIVLFDEIQRFNTLDSDGKPLENTKFTDFWELLSDGRLAKRERDDLDQYLSSYMSRRNDSQKKLAKGEEVDVNRVGVWEAQSLKRMLGLDEEVIDLADRDESDMIGMIQQAKSSKKVYEPVNHSQTLIIISGNLDEAFNMANMTDEADVDADIFHAFTKKVTVVDVKRALTRRFKPEQVARFGNVHLIYPSLRRQDFEALIDREIRRISTSTKERFGVTVKIDKSINSLVYRNGVFPAQGVRPVFSSVSDIVETNLSRLLFTALMDGTKKISLTHERDPERLVARLGTGEPIERPYTGRIDKIRQGRSRDAVANISVHESGHAVAYAVLFGLAPLQLTSKVASTYTAGFTFPHEIFETRANIIKKIQVYLAGGVAEEMIFGVDNATIGRADDREKATQLALDFVRRFGFDEEFQATYTMEFAYSMDKSVTEIDVEKMLTRLVADTHELLTAHESLIVALSSKLLAGGHLEAPVVAKTCAEHGVTAAVQPEGYVHVDAYAVHLDG